MAEQNRTEPGCALVFGASGAIGAALTTRLVASGQFSTVHAGLRRPGSAVPAGAIAFPFALDDEASIAEAVRALPAPPRLVVVATGLLHDNAAGIAPEKSLRAIDAGAMARLFAINTIGPALIAKHCLPLLPKRERAVFAVLSARVGSISDNRLGGWHSYRASKAALNMLVRNFAIELHRSHPMAVVAGLHPGTVDSALSAPFQRGVAPEKLFTADKSAAALLQVIDRLAPADSGGLFAWDGQRIAE